MRKFKLVNDQVYHVFNRGVEKRKIFLDDQDYFRFIHNLYEFNDEDPVINARYYFNPKTMNVESRNVNRSGQEKHKRKQLVEILVFTLMPNHFHLLLRQRRQNGITKFIQKICTGYTMYFNKKYKRVGGLFQGRFKAVLVDGQEHFQYLPGYIHCNPLELKKNYRGPTSIILRERMEFLEEYRWSSYPDYVGKKNFPSITRRGVILDMFGGEKGYKQYTKEYLKEMAEIAEYEALKEVRLD